MTLASIGNVKADPVLGPIRAVFRPRRWIHWITLVLGIGAMWAGVWSLLRVGGFYVSTPMAIIALIGGIFIASESSRRIARRDGLIVATHGFEDRADQSGPILWRSVVELRMDVHGARKELVVGIAKPDGKRRTHRVKISEVYGSVDAIVKALEASRALAMR
jgi:hypothetical protein